MKQILEAKEARRKELEALPFEEKLAMVEKLRDLNIMLASNPLRNAPAAHSELGEGPKEPETD